MEFIIIHATVNVSLYAYLNKSRKLMEGMWRDALSCDTSASPCTHPNSHMLCMITKERMYQGVFIIIVLLLSQIQTPFVALISSITSGCCELVHDTTNLVICLSTFLKWIIIS